MGAGVGEHDGPENVACGAEKAPYLVAARRTANGDREAVRRAGDCRRQRDVTGLGMERDAGELGDVLGVAKAPGKRLGQHKHLEGIQQQVDRKSTRLNSSHT